MIIELFAPNVRRNWKIGRKMNRSMKETMTKELLFSITKKDFKLEWFSGTGNGGQNRNKHQNCARLHHLESGVLTTGQSQRDRPANLREAMQNLVKHPKFKVWMTMRVFELEKGKTIEQIVDEQMTENKLKIECRDEEGKWNLYKEDILNEN
jgi:protein subunit release factor B